ncbi:hypothetical protein HBI81_034380 [Parastagonospora nodorum]|nr:hypothetical protein HBH53_004300 [Parastagonospora nodorum]KAH4007421.1 hypothetical protein HBI10_005080 [Parastagonospora nodorum]KAH4023350.1 hypothetical protein HBI13_086790 [Parastagonospora nodorum]KAH4133200.1 hypothetical protein HBH47_008360 [Parastagonospora nodorum]KAH4419978.1 hypothetical protein HBH92_027590 [Parastagonospora nodorum]
MLQRAIALPAATFQMQLVPFTLERQKTKPATICQFSAKHRQYTQFNSHRSHFTKNSKLHNVNLVKGISTRIAPLRP